jgi:hypothetical protein
MEADNPVIFDAEVIDITPQPTLWQRFPLFLRRLSR